MRATFKLLNAYFWKTIYGPILAFIFPILLLSILGNIMRIQYVLPGIIAMITLFIAVQAMPLGLMEVKNSTLFKYIGSTPVNPKRFISSTIIFYVFIDMLSVILLLIMGSFIFWNQIIPPQHSQGLYSGLATPYGFFSFIIANIIHIILSLAIGTTIAVFSKTPQQALTIALIVIIPSMFLSGMVLSVDIIAQSRAMQWVSRFVPFRYTTGNIVVSMTLQNQIGDLMDMLSLENKKLIFNIVGVEMAPNQIRWLNPSHNDGLILLRDGHHFVNISEMPALIKLPKNIQTEINSTILFKGKSYSATTYAAEYFNKLAKYSTYDITSSFDNLKDSLPSKRTWFQSADSTLFNEVFVKTKHLTSADNNMFMWTQSFGVRKIPDIEIIKNFIHKFFQGETTQKETGEQNPTRFIYIWSQFIKKGNFSFLDLFMKQNVVLYTIVERIMNTLVPIALTISFTNLSIKNFRWISR